MLPLDQEVRFIPEEPKLPPALDESEAMLRTALGNSEDIGYHRFTLQWNQRSGLLVYIRGLVSDQGLRQHVLEPLIGSAPDGPAPTDLAGAGRRWIPIADQRVAATPIPCRDGVFQGKTALLVDGFPGALLLGAEHWKERSIQAPPAESVLRGPRDGFVESLTANVALIRRRLQNAAFRVHHLRVGRRTRSRVALLYLEDLAPPELVAELKSRVEAIDFDGVLDTSQLRELLVGPVFSPFPKMRLTERPDRVVAALLAGRVGVMLDTSPTAALAPVTLVDYLRAPDDFYAPPAVALLFRTVRAVGWGFMTLLTPFYIAVEMYNPALVRTELALFMSRERQDIPLTPALEVIFLELVIEMVMEAAVRLPSKIGSTVTIVGGLIIGQAAVQARLISSIVIIVVAVSAIGSFTVTDQEIGQVWRVVKWFLILAASFFGVYGLFAATFCLLAWLASQDSFGTPYLTPLAPLVFSDLRRGFIHRRSLGGIRRRPATYRPEDPDRTAAAPNAKFRDGGER